MANLISVVNSVLSLVGESQLETTNGQLGELVKNSLQTAVDFVYANVKPTSSETILTFNLTSSDYLSVGLDLPVNMFAINKVYLLSEVGFMANQYPTEIPIIDYDRLYRHTGVSRIGNKLLVSASINRPVNIQVHGLITPSLPALDSETVNIDSSLLSPIKHKAASYVMSGLDDNANSAVQSNLANELMLSLRQKGVVSKRTWTL